MKITTLIFILGALGACGKGSSPAPFHDVTTAEAVRDIDGDGLRDWDTLSALQDPALLAVTSASSPSDPTVPLLLDGEATGFSYRVRRPLREALLRNLTRTNAAGPLPEPQALVDLASTPAYWEARLSGRTLAPLLAGAPFLMQGDPAQTPLLKLAARERGNAADWQQHHYRLVVSLPQGDHAYYLSPTISPSVFLARHFGALFNGEGDIRSMGDLAGAISPVIDWKGTASPARWWCLNAEETPLAGTTVAFAFAGLDEIARASSGMDAPFVADLRELSTFSWHTWRPHDRTLVLFFPPALRQRLRHWGEIYSRTSGNGGAGERGGGPRLRGDYECRYFRSEPSGEDSVSLTRAQALGMFYWGPLVKEVLWEQSSSYGTVLFVDVRDDASPVQWGQFQEVIDAALVVGVHDSECPRLIRNNISHVPEWRRLPVEIYWGE